MEYNFPRTNVGGVSLSRMIIGTNWLAGYSHTGAAADAMIKERHSSTETITPMLEAFMSYTSRFSRAACLQIYKDNRQN